MIDKSSNHCTISESESNLSIEPRTSSSSQPEEPESCSSIDDERKGRDNDVVSITERVRVVVRVRPRNEKEEQSHSNLLHQLKVNDRDGQIYICKKKSEKEIEKELRYEYDRLFSENATQEDVYTYLKDSIQQVAQGFNCTIFAYGQTGTGKTHTMLGRGLEKSSEPLMTSRGTNYTTSWGIIPRAIESLFQELKSIARHGAAAIIYCSYMQIYNNEVFDLLQENKIRMKEPLAVREMIKGNGKHIYISGISEFRVTSVEETMKLLYLGNKNRSIRATEYNEKSSRSHALLQLSAEVESRGGESATIIRRAKLNLVDLAGSEKWDTDVSMGVERTKELTSINQSLSALGNVIAALANPKRSHIPYRDSKLTRILQDSLGGNTRTIMIATISPHVSALEETISTLTFADRAKSVMVRITVNEMVDDAVLLAQAQKEIARLKLLLKQNKNEKVSQLEEKVSRLIAENTDLLNENKKLRKTVNILRKEKEQKEMTRPSTGHLMTNLSSLAALAVPSRPQAARKSTTSLKKNHQTNIMMLTDDPLFQISQLKTELAAPQLKLNNIQDKNQPHQREERLLEEIQTERRHLESELSRLSDSNHGRNEEDGEVCPMCGRIIDNHTDEELDYCIDRETEIMEANKQSQNEIHSTTVSSHPSSSSIHKSPSQGSIRRSSTLDLDKKSKEPSQMRKSPPISSFSSSMAASVYSNNRAQKQQQSLRERRKVIDKCNQQDQLIRGSDSFSRITPPFHDSSESSRDNIPIIRQGSYKSVKMLQKFNADSPYNVPQGKKPKSLDKKSEHVANGELQENGINNSIHDIGLNLMVYKYRYDSWYPCTIVGFDSKRKLHCCQYEYGDKQWLDLRERKFKVVDSTDE